MALGKFFVVAVRGATLTEMESVTFATRATGAVLSDTTRVKLERPCEAGMPVMVPPDERLNPAGSEPDFIVHE
jgi:hypothetical protein